MKKRIRKAFKSFDNYSVATYRWFKSSFTRLRSDNRGVATYLFRGIVGLVGVAIVWWLGNLLLFGDIGVVDITENLAPATERLGSIDEFVVWSWKGFLFLSIVAVFVYIIYGAIKEEVYVK